MTNLKHNTTRPRRNRKNIGIRALLQETTLNSSDFVYPLFIQEGTNLKSSISSMPNVYRYTLDLLPEICNEALKEGIHGIALFPLVPEQKKDSLGSEAINPNNLICRAISQLKKTHPDLVLFSDVALDPYSSDGHDGIVKDGDILNDESLELLSKMAVNHANAGVDIVAPSDMMDGRVAEIRKTLDQAGHQNTSICSYTIKYASSFYGPFRDALESAPKAGDKKTYQMNPANRLEAMRELELDTTEGADIIMIKPAGAYLDIIRDVKHSTALPVAAYQVSGEYSMIHAGAEKGLFDLDQAMYESLLAIKRAGADLIFSYAALDIARQLNYA